METVILAIMALSVVSFILKLTFHRLPGLLTMGLLAALFILIVAEPATGLSKTLISDWLSSPQLMLDTAVVLTVDVAVQIYFCYLYADARGRKLTMRERATMGVCLWLPGLLIFPVLAAILTGLYFTLTGIDFSTIAFTASAVALILFPLLAWAVRRLIPESDLRLELLFMSGIIIAALGTLATVNGTTYVQAFAD